MTSQIWIIKHAGGWDPDSHLQQVLHSNMLRAHCLKGGGNIRTRDSGCLESNSICWIWQGHCTHKPNSSCDCMHKNLSQAKPQHGVEERCRNPAPHWGAMNNGQLLGGGSVFFRDAAPEDYTCSSRPTYTRAHIEVQSWLSALKKHKNKKVHEVGERGNKRNWRWGNWGCIWLKHSIYAGMKFSNKKTFIIKNKMSKKKKRTLPSRECHLCPRLEDPYICSWTFL